MKVYVNRSEDWLRWIAPEEFNDEDLFRIVVFFVFHSPCSTLSSMSRTLDVYGWNTPWGKPYYLNKQLKRSSSNYNLLFSACNYNAIEDALRNANLWKDFTNDLRTERICIYDNMHNQFLSVFYHIRNALAHCRINIVDVDGECVFIMEDVVPERKHDRLKLSARMIIKKSTLLNWIDLIEGGEQEYKSEILI